MYKRNDGGTRLDMDQRRYAKLIQYKAALDSAWKRRNPVGIYGDEEYEKTLW